MDKDIRLKNGYISAFLCEDKYLKDMILINTKCLIDDKINRCVYVDYNRLKGELAYYKFYGFKNINYLSNLNILLPIIIANTNLDKSEREAIRNIRYYVLYNKINEYLYDYILSSVVYNYTIHTILSNSQIEYHDLLQQIKQRIIDLKIDIDKSEVILFEKNRIKYIQTIDRYLINNNFEKNEGSIINNFLNLLHQIFIEDQSEVIEGFKSIKNSILSILNLDINQININNIEFIDLMANYILKLRNYKVNKKNFDEKVDPRTIISLNIGDTEYDPILNNIKVLDKKFDNNILSIKLESKSGNYIFKFKKS
jgi:hypothetical protein